MEHPRRCVDEPIRSLIVANPEHDRRQADQQQQPRQPIENIPSQSPHKTMLPSSEPSSIPPPFFASWFLCFFVTDSNPLGYRGASKEGRKETKKQRNQGRGSGLSRVGHDRPAFRTALRRGAEIVAALGTEAGMMALAEADARCGEDEGQEDDQPVGDGEP